MRLLEKIKKYFAVYKQPQRRGGFTGLEFLFIASLIGGAAQQQQATKSAKKAAAKAQKILAKPIESPATELTGGLSDEARRRQRSRVSGRRKTIVTGELSPKSVKKKTLLGR